MSLRIVCRDLDAMLRCVVKLREKAEERNAG
jgi:hypothetical protein